MVMAPPLEQMSSMVLGFTKGEAPATPSVSRNHARARRFQNDDVRRVCIARDYGGDIGPTATFLRNGGCRSRSGKHTSEIQSQAKLVFRLFLLKKKKNIKARECL